MWTRFFPASVEVRRLLAQGEIGQAKYVRSDFCVPVLHVERSVKKELGAGAMLDLGIYCLQFSLMVFNGEKPESVQATATCLETGESADQLHTTALAGCLGQRGLLCWTNHTKKSTFSRKCMIYNTSSYWLKPGYDRSVKQCLMSAVAGADETVIVTLKFSGNRLAVFTGSSSFLLPNEAVVVGTKGTIKVGFRTKALCG